MLHMVTYCECKGRSLRVTGIDAEALTEANVDIIIIQLDILDKSASALYRMVTDVP
jgi:hypothetical protein